MNDVWNHSNFWFDTKKGLWWWTWCCCPWKMSSCSWSAPIVAAAYLESEHCNLVRSLAYPACQRSWVKTHRWACVNVWYQYAHKSQINNNRKSCGSYGLHADHPAIYRMYWLILEPQKKEVKWTIRRDKVNLCSVLSLAQFYFSRTVLLFQKGQQLCSPTLWKGDAVPKKSRSLDLIPLWIFRDQPFWLSLNCFAKVRGKY